MKEQEMVLTIFGAIFVLWLTFSLGPLVIIMASLTFLILRMMRTPTFIVFSIAVIAALSGMVMSQDLTLWLCSPAYMMWDFYSKESPGGLLYLLLHPGMFSDFLKLLTAQTNLWLKTPLLWAEYFPAGSFCGALTYSLSQVWHNHPLSRLKRQKVMEKPHGSVSPFAANINNTREAHTFGGSIIGADKYARAVELTDKAANQHTLVLGTTGSGKTVTVCNIVESAVNRGVPLIYIDGKGDYDLARRVEKYGEEKDRPVSVFSMRGKSVKYNPLATGGFTSKKDRIIELRDWSEEHYKKLAEGYLQSVFKVMEACKIPCNMISLAENLDLKKLKALVRENEKNIPNAQSLMNELNNQKAAADNIESLMAEIRNFTASEIGSLFKIEEEKPVLTLAQVIETNGIAYFCLPALEFPSMSQTLGRLIINDLKATMAQELMKGNHKKVYVVFDEFSIFAGEQVLNVINMGRSAGIHAVLSTQSLSDIASGRKENADHFINQVVANCNNFILHRQNSAEDAEQLAAMIGTRKTLEYTAQVNQIGSANMGTVRSTRGFVAHPDEIKSLKTGEAFFFSKESNKISRIKTRNSRI